MLSFRASNLSDCAKEHVLREVGCVGIGSDCSCEGVCGGVCVFSDPRNTPLGNTELLFGNPAAGALWNLIYKYSRKNRAVATIHVFKGQRYRMRPYICVATGFYMAIQSYALRGAALGFKG